MHAELQLKRVFQRAGYLQNEKCLYVVDNVGFHHGEEVTKAFFDAGFLLDYLRQIQYDRRTSADVSCL